MLQTKRRFFGNIVGHAKGVTDTANLSSWTAEQFDPQLDWTKIARIRDLWGGKLILKGILDAEDARIAADFGADAIVVSNHGGRQLDGALSSIRVLPEIVAAVGDQVEVHLKNHPDSWMMHNVDFHAATGALGGAKLTFVAPGQEAVLRFKADRSGTFVYHCAPEGMVAWHVLAGMSGTLMVLPREGLKDPDGNPLHYDRAYTIGEFDQIGRAHV